MASDGRLSESGPEQGARQNGTGGTAKRSGKGPRILVHTGYRQAVLLPYTEARARALADIAAFGEPVDEVGPYTDLAYVPAETPTHPRMRFDVIPASDPRLRPLTAAQQAELRKADRWAPAEVSKSQGSADAAPASEGGAA